MLQLPDIVGQDEAIGRLRDALRSNRLPHAMLFAGPDGVGRRTTARALAAAMLCPHAQTARGAALFGDEADGSPPIEACGQCEDCRMLAEDAHPDFHVVYKELARFHEDANVRGRVMQELGIEIIRSFLIAPANRGASRGHGKVFVVLEAHLMSQAAQNALLKTLEEPPGGARIILVSRRPDQLLPTTLSRCALVRFNLLPASFVVERLADEGVDQPEAAFWARLTGGSLGRALELHRAGLYETKREILDSLAALAGGTDENVAGVLAKTMDTLAERAIREVKAETDAALSKTLASRRAAGVMLEMIAAGYRDAMTTACGSSREPVHADQQPQIETIARRFSPTQLAEILEQLSEYERLLWRNVNPKTVWDNVAITCASAAALRL